MAEKLSLPNRVINLNNYLKDPPIDYAIYGGSEEAEGKYVSPGTVEGINIRELKARKVGQVALFSLPNRKAA